MTIGRSGSKPYLVLEDNDGTFDDLITIKTKKEYRKEITEAIKRNIANWLRNPFFDDVRNKTLDLAIVARVSSNRMKRQDIDNIAKIILDALKEKEGDPLFLFHDDSQVVRLLVWKILREETPGYNTDSVTISFRVHNDKKQMILIQEEEM